MSAWIRVLAIVLATSTPRSQVDLPGGAGGVGLDDLRFSDELGELLVPAGRTGRLDLLDPATGRIRSVEGFSRADSPGRGHEQGATSADSGGGRIFAIDRTERTLLAVDPDAKRIVARAKLAGGPDYVRWVAPAREVWVTEPGREAIETFRYQEGSPPRLTRTGSISMPEAPESLVVDSPRRRAYTNTFHDQTMAIDVDSHAVVARWPNHCRGARGIALDATRGLLFVGCDEGKAVALDVVHEGTTTGEARAGDGVDVIAYSPRLGHLYVPAAGSATLTLIGIGARGELAVLGTIPTVPDAHCAAADLAGNVYVCDPRGGRLLVFHDPYPRSP